MKNILKFIALFVVISSLLCGCAEAGNKGPVLTLSEDDLALIEAFGEDLNVVDPADFAGTVSGLNAEASGKVYQMTGYFQAAAEGAENPALGNAKSNPSVSIELRYLTQELTAGDQYTVTGVVTVEAHDGHAHITLDVLTVETYTSK